MVKKETNEEEKEEEEEEEKGVIVAGACFFPFIRTLGRPNRKEGPARSIALSMDPPVYQPHSQVTTTMRLMKLGSSYYRR